MHVKTIRSSTTLGLS